MEPQASPENTNSLRGILDSYPGSGNVGSLATSLIKEMISLRKAVVDRKWPKVKELGIRCLGLGHGILRVLEGEVRARGLRSNSLRASFESFDDALRQIAQGENRPVFFEEFRKLLAAESPELLDKLDGVLRKLEQGQTDGVSIVSEIIPPERLRIVPVTLDVAKNAMLAGLVRGSLGLIHADFNLAYQALEPDAESISEADIRGALKELTEEFASQLRARQLAIYDSLASSRSVREAVEVAESLGAFVEQELPRLARAQAVAHLVSGVLRSKGQNGEAEEIGRITVQAGALTREAIASQVTASLLAIDLMRLPVPETTNTLISLASAVQFDGRLPNGKDTPLAKLDQVKDGAFVEIEGFVTGLKVIRATEKKLISRVQLTDPSSGATALAATVFTHLPHVGLTRGSFCRINGIFRKESRLIGGRSGVEVDRLAQAELSEKIWRVAFLRTANRWFENWRNGNNMYWSMGPHRIASTPKDVSFLGAGELIFTPFIRN